MRSSRPLVRAAAAFAAVASIACGHAMTPSAPAPQPAGVPIANTYILPGAVDLGMNAFGDDPIVIFKGEQMRWRNLDKVEHNVVTDTASLPEFGTTGVLAPLGEQSFVMNTVGETKIHCTIHPQMVGTLIVRER
jgi:plastocyanin